MLISDKVFGYFYMDLWVLKNLNKLMERERKREREIKGEKDNRINKILNVYKKFFIIV